MSEGVEDALAVLAPHLAEIEEDFREHNERYLAISSVNTDVIGRVLRVHLVIENFLTSYLHDTYFIDTESARLTFFQKTSMLPKANTTAAFLKPSLLELNSVRNKFAHRLDHKITFNEIGSLTDVLGIARKGSKFETPITAIEAFAPIACAFLAVPLKRLQTVFAEAFSKITVHSNTEEE